ncbi:hypothetical protein VA596_11080 [Amycolatopsis sp., V23-08]|uniref:Uncharacterized protein n=1 Tax=Amycolatopsis heterodermiae TaxID=3110235 RepID=A0ABU5R451_9PSEU|nr:hypothetical protein [Amycolatopsis sp., V23-08]MEA5360081.1 hypothetical protein [Amycolatopsis sp., V23-08]
MSIGHVLRPPQLFQKRFDGALAALGGVRVPPAVDRDDQLHGHVQQRPFGGADGWAAAARRTSASRAPTASARSASAAASRPGGRSGLFASPASTGGCTGRSSAMAASAAAAHASRPASVAVNVFFALACAQSAATSAIRPRSRSFVQLVLE